jgi:hypothetical protein
MYLGVQEIKSLNNIYGYLETVLACCVVEINLTLVGVEADVEH